MGLIFMVFSYTKSSVIWAKTLSLCLLSLPVHLVMLDAARAVGAAPSRGRSLQSAKLPRQIAQAEDPRKVEADRLFQTGIDTSVRTSPFVTISFMERALILYREIKDEKGQMSALHNLGLAYYSLIRFPESIEYYQQGLKIARRLKEREVEVGILNDLGFAYKDSIFGRDYAKAIECHQQALSIAREIRYRIGQIDSLNRLGFIYKDQNQYQQAIDYYQQGLTIARDSKDQKGEIMFLGNIQLAYEAQGNYEQARVYAQQKTAIGREPKERQIELELSEKLKRCREIKEGYRCEIFALRGAANRYSNLLVYPKAIEYFQQGLKIAREAEDKQQESLFLLDIAHKYSNLKNHEMAIEYYQKSLSVSRDISDINTESRALAGLGEARRASGKDVVAENSFDTGRSLPIVQTIPRNRSGISRDFDKGLDLFKSGRLAEAEKLLLDAIQGQESWARQLTGGDYKKLTYYYYYNAVKYYSVLQQVLIAQNKIESALEIAERGRTRALAEYLAKQLQSTENPLLQPIQIKMIKQVAKVQNATLVEYAKIDDKSLFVWVVNPNGRITFRNVDLTPLKQQKTSLDQLIASARCQEDIDCAPGLTPRGKPRSGQKIVRNASQPDQTLASSTSPESTPPYSELQHLHKLLIEPIADLLPKDPNAQVIFVPQSSLFLVPFAALQDSQDKYLIERHTIRVAPSIQVLELTRQQRQKVQQAGLQQSLVVGNPSMPMQLSPLPNAQLEAEAIATLLKTKAITGSQATKAAILRQMPNARLIHLATHGLLDSESGLNSSIALAPDGTGKPNDGLLTADEILNLKLNAELVVLSACSTGKGRITGDGVIGLSRSLMTAGVPSVLVSLWAVPDDSTAFLMQEFYRQLQRNPDKAQALRQAMLQTLKQYADIRSWSAFVLMGESQ